ASHKSLDRIDCILGVRYRLPLGDLTDEAVAVFGESHDRWGGATPLCVSDHDRLATFHDGYDLIRRSQVNFYDFAHFQILRCFEFRPSREIDGLNAGLE